MTQGYATIEEGLKIFDEIALSKLTIVTEGYNTNYITKSLNLYGIENVEVLQGLEGKSGKNQLKTLFDFFALIDHKKDILFVFDCDVDHLFETKGHTHHFTFSRNTNNQIAKKGIENLFDESLLAKFTSIIIDPAGKETKSFHEPSKRKFENFILNRSLKSDFANFNDLMEEVKRIKEISNSVVETSD